MNRFWEKVDNASGAACWQWLGAIQGDGYGNFGIWPKTIYAHRYAYENKVGPIPEGMCVLHRCDNRGCVNPGHLFIGTKKDNAHDRDRKGRQKPHRGRRWV